MELDSQISMSRKFMQKSTMKQKTLENVTKICASASCMFVNSRFYSAHDDPTQ